jgi:hypothetical protein
LLVNQTHNRRGKSFYGISKVRRTTRLIAMAGVTASDQAAGSWPMSNEEIQQWFSRDNIPLDELIQMWMIMDQNDKTKTEILRLKDAGDIKDLEKRLGQRIQFGTAGDSTTFNYLWRRSTRTHGSRLLAHERFDRNTSFSSSSTESYSNSRVWQIMSFET